MLIAQPSVAMTLHGEKSLSAKLYKPSKTAVMKTLDKMKVKYTVDKDGDLLYTMNKKGWIGYVIFNMAGKDKNLWSIQVRTQFATKSSYYDDLVVYANEWNANHMMPKVAMKTPSKIVLSLYYPVQYGFNPDEFKYNVFHLFNRAAEKVAKEMGDMRH
ncbi:hypothetical protein JCM30760_07310 [Thiomicrorhabdus hydrogeniphila]